MNLYNEFFFKDRQNISLLSASIIVPEIINIFEPNSVVDFGCGMGEWLKIFKDNNIDDILGIDGYHINKDNLLINKKNFIAHDLNKAIEIKKFDLAICLEVAEHLDYLSSETIVNSLVQSSDNIVFSAAIPGQGGTGHINEQPHSFWANKFIDHGYIVSDYLRIKFMENKKIPFWYRQNILIFSKNKNFKLISDIDFSVPSWDKEEYFE